MALDNESAALTNHYIDRPDSSLSFVLGDESISLNFLNTKLIDKFSAQASGHCGYCCAQVCSRYIEWLWCKNSPELIRIDAWGPPKPFIRRAAFRTISVQFPYNLILVNWVWDIFDWPEKQRSETGLLWTLVFSMSCAMTSSLRGRTPPPSFSVR